MAHVPPGTAVGCAPNRPPSAPLATVREAGSGSGVRDREADECAAKTRDRPPLRGAAVATRGTGPVAADDRRAEGYRVLPKWATEVPVGPVGSGGDRPRSRCTTATKGARRAESWRSERGAERRPRRGPERRPS